MRRSTPCTYPTDIYVSSNVIFFCTGNSGNPRVRYVDDSSKVIKPPEGPSGRWTTIIFPSPIRPSTLLRPLFCVTKGVFGAKVTGRKSRFTNLRSSLWVGVCPEKDESWGVANFVWAVQNYSIRTSTTNYTGGREQTFFEAYSH